MHHQTRQINQIPRLRFPAGSHQMRSLRPDPEPLTRPNTRPFMQFRYQTDKRQKLHNLVTLDPASSRAPTLHSLSETLGPVARQLLVPQLLLSLRLIVGSLMPPNCRRDLLEPTALSLKIQHADLDCRLGQLQFPKVR
jgi:hypothetical protein